MFGSQPSVPVFIGYLGCNSESIIHTNISGSAWAFATPSLLTSSACPDEIVVAMDDVGEISISREGTVQMDSAPIMASATNVGRLEALGSWYSSGRRGSACQRWRRLGLLETRHDQRATEAMRGRSRR